MTTTPIAVEAFEIIDALGLDPIQVFWRDIQLGSGYCTIICYGQAWTIYFGGMGDRTIRRFFAEVGSDYLVNKLGDTRDMKQASVKRYEAYLRRIVEAVQASLRSAASVAA